MKRVLIVEDDPVWSKVLEEYCRDEGLVVDFAISPQSALDKIDEHVPDLIILDMLLSTETGMALLNEIQGYGDLADVKIIVCSSVDGIQLEQLKPFGVQYVLDKSTMQPIDMRSAIRSLISEQK